MVATIIICLVLAVVLLLGIRAGIKRGKSGCCGNTIDIENDVVVTDKNEANYPYSLEFEITGMHCDNCKKRIENSLNKLNGVWASVELQTGKAIVRMKKEYSSIELINRIDALGYKAELVK